MYDAMSEKEKEEMKSGETKKEEQTEGEKMETDAKEKESEKSNEEGKKEGGLLHPKFCHAWSITPIIS